MIHQPARDMRAVERARAWIARILRQDRFATRDGWAQSVIARHGLGGCAEIDGESRRVFLRFPGATQEAAVAPAIPESSPARSSTAVPSPARVLERIFHRTVERVVHRSPNAPPRLVTAFALRRERLRQTEPAKVVERAVFRQAFPARTLAKKLTLSATHRGETPVSMRESRHTVLNRLTTRLTRVTTHTTSERSHSLQERSTQHAHHRLAGTLVEGTAPRQSPSHQISVRGTLLERIGKRESARAEVVRRSPSGSRAEQGGRLSSQSVQPEPIGRRFAARSRMEWDARDTLPPGRVDRATTWNPTQPWPRPAADSAPARVMARPMLAAAAVLGKHAVPAAPVASPGRPQDAAPARPPFAAAQRPNSSDAQPPLSLDALAAGAASPAAYRPGHPRDGPAVGGPSRTIREDLTDAFSRTRRDYQYRDG